MAIPTGDVGTVHTFHDATAHHHVLKHLVHQVAKVNRTVGVRRAVVKTIKRLLTASLADLRVHVVLQPALEGLGFVLIQIRPHRKIRTGKIQSVLECPFAVAHECFSGWG